MCLRKSLVVPKAKRFGSTNLCSLLKKLNFSPVKQKGSSHQKWRPPNNLNKPDGRPFLIVIQGKKQYPMRTCNSYIKQLVQFGFDFEKIKKHLK